MPNPNVVDLSEYQTKNVNKKMDIDFADLKKQGIKAVILRLGHGFTRDQGVEQFIKQAKQAGLIVHGYHFYEYGKNNQVQWSIKNAKDLGLDENAYYFLDMEGNIPTGWGDYFRPFYRNWKMAGWNVGIYASLSKYGEFNLKELDANGVYKWVADWDVGQAPGIADVWQYNCSVGLGKYTLKLDKDVDITGKLIQSVKAPEQLETDPNGQYPVKAGAFVDFDYSTTSIVGGKMLISSPDGINKIPKLGPDGSFIFNQKDGDRMWVFIKDKISTGQSLNWNNIQNKPAIPSVEGLAKESELADYVKKSEVPKLPDLNGYALKSELPSLKGYAKLTDIPSVVGLVKEAELNDYVKKSDIPKIPDLSGYATVASLIDYAKKTDLPDFSQFVKKSEIPKLPDTSNFATKDVVQQVQTTADSASNKAEQAQSTADANKKDLDNIKANNQVSQVTSGDFNNLTENKTYEISSNSGYTHAPVSGKKGILVVHAGQQCLVQVFYAVDDFVYRRIRYANRWHDWKWNNDWN